MKLAPQRTFFSFPVMAGAMACLLSCQAPIRSDTGSGGSSGSGTGGTSSSGGSGASSSGGNTGGGGAATGGAAGAPLSRGPTPPMNGTNFPFPQNRQSANCIYPTAYDND